MAAMGKKQFFHYSQARADWLKKRKKNLQETNGDAALGTMEALKNAFDSQSTDSNPTEEASTEPSVGCQSYS